VVMVKNPWGTSGWGVSGTVIGADVTGGRCSKTSGGPHSRSNRVRFRAGDSSTLEANAARARGNILMIDMTTSPLVNRTFTVRAVASGSQAANL